MSVTLAVSNEDKLALQWVEMLANCRFAQSFIHIGPYLVGTLILPEGVFPIECFLSPHPFDRLHNNYGWGVVSTTLDTGMPFRILGKNGNFRRLLQINTWQYQARLSRGANPDRLIGQALAAWLDYYLLQPSTPRTVVDFPSFALT